MVGGDGLGWLADGAADVMTTTLRQAFCRDGMKTRSMSSRSQSGSWVAAALEVTRGRGIAVETVGGRRCWWRAGDDDLTQVEGARRVTAGIKARSDEAGANCKYEECAATKQKRQWEKKREEREMRCDAMLKGSGD